MLDLQEPLLKRLARVMRVDEKFPREKKERKKWLIWMIAFAMIFCVATIGWVYKQIHKLEHSQKSLRRSVKMLRDGGVSTLSSGTCSLPFRLSGIPFADDLGIVVRVKQVPIRDISAPYNPSLIQSPSGYELFFRYDVINPKLKYAPFSSCIGVVSLNDQFQQGDEEFQKIQLQTEYAEDPRVLFVGDQLYLFYNRLDEATSKCRFMCAANLDRKTHHVNYNTVLDLNLHWIEKNWSPFEYIGEDRKSRLFLEYQISPRKLMALPDPRVNELKNVTLPAELAYFTLLWPDKWGELRGGSPAKKIGDEYLTFFHSSFSDERGARWYVMGAYTFDARPPFNITGMSKYPILFKGIYDTPITNTASFTKRVIFPSGFVVEKTGDREWIHLACGENDSGVKIVTIDKEKLLKSMTRFESAE